MRLAVIISLLIGAIGTGGLKAAPGTGGCVPASNLVSAERATQFLENPAALLDQFKEGQGSLASQVRDFLTVRPETLEGVASLAKASSADQSRAIGAGLGTAASVCVLTQPAFAQQIQEVVLKTENPELIRSFVSITGDIPTEATAGADATGDTSAGGGQGTTATERAGAVPTSNTPFVTETAGTAVTPTSTTAVFTAASLAGSSASTPVSPSR